MREVIYILWQRQLKHYLRSRSRLIGSLGQPLLFLISFGFGFGPMYTRASGGGNYIDFLAPGIIAMAILFTAVFSGLEVIWDRQFGFLKETFVAPISRTEIMIGKTLGGATIALIQGLVVFGLTFLMGFKALSFASVGLGLLFMFLIAVFFAGLGLSIASKMKDMQGFQILMNFLIMPMFFLSGALFPVENLPGPIYFLTRVNPLTYGVDGLRGALTGMSVFGVPQDFAITALLSVFICILGTIFFSSLEA